MRIGIGRYLKNTNRTTISVLGGLAWQNTVYNPIVLPIATENVATAVINTNVQLFKFNKMNLDLNAVLLPALSEAGRVYIFYQRVLLDKDHRQSLMKYLVLR